MERKIVLLNGSPRAPKSNSRRYAAIFREHCPVAADYFEITRRNHAMLCSKMDEYTDVVLVFPLYADSLPVSLQDFLKSLEAARSERRPTVSVMINCGFLEYEQNMVAVDMVRLFCRRNGYPFGSVLMIGGGEAILDTPFRLLAGRRIAAFARAVAEEKSGRRTCAKHACDHADNQTHVRMGVGHILAHVRAASRCLEAADGVYADRVECFTVNTAGQPSERGCPAVVWS